MLGEHVTVKFLWYFRSHNLTDHNHHWPVSHTEPCSALDTGQEVITVIPAADDTYGSQQFHNAISIFEQLVASGNNWEQDH